MTTASRRRRVIGVVLALVTLLDGGCADGGADHILLDRFFAASRLRDRTALARIATVIFEPHQDGIVERIWVRSTTAPRLLEGYPPPTRRSLEPDATTMALDHVARLSLDADLDDNSPSSAALDARIETRQITLNARIRPPAGKTIEREVRVTVQRAERREAPPKTGRWIVTGFE